jgi:hypothetical protein
MAASRASDGRFRPRYENVVLWRVIVEVAVLARPDYPQAVTREEWDEARALSFWPDAPSAAALCKRFATAWRALIALAFDDGRDWVRSVGMRPQVALVADLSAEEIRQSIRCVWQAIGRPSSLSAPRYENGLDELRKADPQGFSIGIAPSQLANANQIIYAAGSWARALVIAELDVPARGSYRRVLSVVEALDGYVEETGRLAPVPWIVHERRAKRQERIATPRAPSAEYVAQLRAHRAGRGLDTPEMDARGTAHAELKPGMPASDWAPDLGWTWDACVFALAQLLLRLPPGTRSMTQARHRQLVPGTGAPWPATLQRVVTQENAERRAKRLAADLTVADLWAAAARRAVALRAQPAIADQLPRPQRLERAEVACRFARAHTRWPKRKELEQFAADECLRMQPRHGNPHAGVLARARERLARDDAMLAVRVGATRNRSHLETPELADERAAAARARANARRRAKRALGPRRRRGSPLGVPICDAIAEFADEQDAYPSSNLLRYWARHLRGMSLAFPTRRYDEDLDRVARNRRSAGKPPITVRLTMADTATLRPVNTAPPPISKRRKQWPHNEVLAAVPRVAAFARGERLTPAAWIRATKGRADLPSISTLRLAVSAVNAKTVSQYLSDVGQG